MSAPSSPESSESVQTSAPVSAAGSFSDVEGAAAAVAVRERWRTVAAIGGAAVVALALLGAVLWPSWLRDPAPGSWLTWWVGPVERLPAFKTMRGAPDLHAIAFAGEHGWIVGDAGTILTTNDGGQSWHGEESGVTSALRDVGISVPALGPGVVAPREIMTVFALAEDGTLLRHNDDNSWERWANQAGGSFSKLFVMNFDLALAGGANGVWRGHPKQGEKNTTEIEWLPVGPRLGNADGIALLSNFFAVTESGRWLTISAYAYDEERTKQGMQSGMTSSAIWKDPSPLMEAGRPWDLPETTAPLAVVFLDSSRGWMVGDKGSVWRTDDGGKTWAMRDIGANQALVGVAFRYSESGDASKEGWILGAAGAVYGTTDGGETWTALPGTGVETGLTGLTIDDRGTLWAIGAHGVVLSSSNGGATWHRVAFYEPWPARIYWVLGGAGFLVLLAGVAWPMRQLEVVRSIENVLVADKPLDDPARSPAWMRKLVTGLANFMSNPNTAAPVTLAITGPWGRGKSSVMSLLKAELERREHRPVWFNAWHHQDTENVLAALLGTIREQAIPPLVAFPAEPPFLSFPGVWFYLRLTWQRVRRRWAYVAVMSAVLLTAVSWVVLNWRNLEAIRWSGLLDTLASGEGAGVLGALLVGSYPLTKLLGMLKTFGIDPAALLASGEGKAKELEAANVFRSRFGVEFAEVTSALGRRQRMVIFIDDLDRCAPVHLLKVLEATNVLNSSGQCFVVLGMQRETVLACLRSTLDEALLGGSATPERWLEKLVQIEVPVPRDEQALAGIVGGAAAPDQQEAKRRKRRAWQRLAVLVPSGLATLAVVGLGCVGVARSLTLAPPAPVAAVKEAAKDVAKDKTAASEVDPTQGRAPASKTNSPRSTREAPPQARTWVEPRTSLLMSDEAGRATANGLAKGAVLVGLAGLGVVLLVTALRRRFGYRVEDSPAFVQAIALWAPVLRARCETPREIKVLLNRMRLDAMLVREFTPRAADGGAAGPEASAGYEADVVGLAVLEHFMPEGLGDEAWVDLVNDDDALRRAGAQAVATYRSEAFRLFRLFKDHIRVGARPDAKHAS